MDDSFKHSHSVSIMGYPVWKSGLKNCADAIVRSIRASERRWLACLNPHSYVTALEKPEFRKALFNADFLLPDGFGIVIASKILGVALQERVTGPDLFIAVCDAMQAAGGGTVFFLGSTDHVLNEIRNNMARDWPAINIVGTWSPPFKARFSDDDNREMVSRINSVRPDMLWVGMTAPKQEEWLYKMLPSLDIRFAGAVGAVFDFYTGQVKRSHPLFRRLGLEWLPRLIQQPRRLWRRTFISAPIFMWQVLRAKVTGSQAF